MIRCNIWELHRLRAEGWEHSDGSDECVCALVHLGALRPGLSYDEVVRVLGKPDWDGADPRTGERRGTWLTMDLGHGTDSWVVTFGPDNRARFVPYISKRETDASGTRIAHYVRRPDDDPAAGE